MTEDLILVDENDRQIGTLEKLQAHERGLRHRAFSIIVWDGAGRMLFQQRHIGKYHSGGLWTNTCCGHPRPGEEVAYAAHRRLGEEMGFDCILHAAGTIEYRAELDRGLTEHEIVHVFRGLYAGPFTVNPHEVDATAWLTTQEIKERIARDPSSFSVWFRKYVDAGWPVESLAA